MKQAQQMQEKLQKEMESTVVEATAGGGMVSVKMNGQKQLLSIQIEPEVFTGGDKDMLQDLIVAARVLINGAPIASYVSTRHPEGADRQPTSFDDRPEGIARDRWDVALETLKGTTLVECGAIRERVSQELARLVFDAVKKDLEARDRN